MILSRDNHYVPQMYLKAWANENKIWAYSLLVSDPKVPHWKKESIKNTAFRKDLYTNIGNNNNESDTIEHFLDKNFESPAMIPLKKAIEGSSLSKDDLIILSRFVASQCVRTPAWYIKNLKQWGNTLPQIFEDTLNKLANEMSNMDINDIKLNKSSINTNYFPLKVTRTGKVVDDKELIEVNSYIGKSMWFFAINHILTKTCTLLNKHNWRVITAAPGISWPTSDDPVICLNFYNNNNYDFNGGWDNEGSEIILPISPTKILYTQVGKDCRLKQFDLKTSHLIKKLIIEHAHRKIYCNSPQKNMRNLRERVEDPLIFKEEETMLKNWYSTYVETESEFIFHTSKQDTNL